MHGRVKKSVVHLSEEEHLTRLNQLRKGKKLISDVLHYKEQHSYDRGACTNETALSPINRHDCDTTIEPFEIKSNLLSMTYKLLEFHPEFGTIWNYRRTLLLKEFDQLTLDIPFKHLNNIDIEITNNTEKCDTRSDNSCIDTVLTIEFHLCEKALKKSWKSYSVWFHRRWIFEKALTLYQLYDNPMEKCFCLFQSEFQLCAKLLRGDDRNFHCWNYRYHLLELLKHESYKEFACNLLEEMIKENRLQYKDDVSTYPVIKETPSFEMGTHTFKVNYLVNLFNHVYSRILINHNFSNYSAWHIRSLLTEQDEYKIVDLKKELDCLRQALYTEPNDESIWKYYSRFILKTLRECLCVQIGLRNIIATKYNSQSCLIFYFSQPVKLLEAVINLNEHGYCLLECIPLHPIKKTKFFGLLDKKSSESSLCDKMIYQELVNNSNCNHPQCNKASIWILRIPKKQNSLNLFNDIPDVSFPSCSISFIIELSRYRLQTNKQLQVLLFLEPKGLNPFIPNMTLSWDIADVSESSMTMMEHMDEVTFQNACQFKFSSNLNLKKLCFTRNLNDAKLFITELNEARQLIDLENGHCKYGLIFECQLLDMLQFLMVRVSDKTYNDIIDVFNKTNQTLIHLSINDMDHHIISNFNKLMKIDPTRRSFYSTLKNRQSWIHRLCLVSDNQDNLFSNNHLKDLPPASSILWSALMPCRTLNLACNHIDIKSFQESGLYSLIHLQSLDISNNHITDLNLFLNGLPKKLPGDVAVGLTVLNLTGNPLSNGLTTPAWMEQIVYNIHLNETIKTNEIKAKNETMIVELILPVCYSTNYSYPRKIIISRTTLAAACLVLSPLKLKQVFQPYSVRLFDNHSYIL